MSALDTKWPTLLDVQRRLAPNGSVETQIAEILEQQTPAYEDMPFFEGNLETGHRHTIRSGLPTPTWRKLYGGVQPTKSTTVQVTDATGSLEAYAEVDKKLADLNGNTKAFRLSEDRAHIQGIGIEFEQTLFYGNEASEPEAFTGLAPRFNSLSAQDADNIIDAGGTGSDNASIWLIVWGQDGAWGLYPKGSKGGLTMEDKGQVTVENVDGSNGRAEMYRSHYVQDCGLAVKDWRQIVRICNIDVSDLATLANTKNIVTWMTQATELIYNLNAGRAVFYMPRKIRSYLRLGILEKIANNLTWETVAGKRVMVFDEVAVKRSDALLLTEARVT